MNLPLYTAEDVEAGDDMCQTCALRLRWGQGRCEMAEYRKYTQRDLPANTPVDLVVVADAPSRKDRERVWTDQEGQALLKQVKSLGFRSFIVAPALRCYPGEIDHFRMRKKYKGGFGPKEKSDQEKAEDSVTKCGTYLRDMIAGVNPRFVLAMGPLATKALELKGSVPQLRVKPLHPKPGLRHQKQVEGTLVTYDRFQTKKSWWARYEQAQDFEKLRSIVDTGYATPRAQKTALKIHVADTVAKVKQFVDWVLTEQFEADELWCFDFETESLLLSKEHNRLLNVGFSRRHDEDTSYVIPLAHPETPFSADDLVEVYAQLKRLFTAEGASFFGWVAHHAQFETEMIKLFFDMWIGDLGKPILCTEVMSYLLDEDRKEDISHPNRLETLASNVLGFTWYAESGMKQKRDRLIDEPLVTLNEYVGVDAAVTARLLNALLERAIAEGFDEDMLRLCVKLYSPATVYTSDMRFAGQKQNHELLRKLRASDSTIVARIAEVKETFLASPEVAKAIELIASGGGKKKASRYANVPRPFAREEAIAFNLDSPDHKRALFWDVMHIDGADESVDKKWQEQNKYIPLVALYQEYQALTKLDRMYLEPIAKWLQSPNSLDGRLRPYFNLINTSTGRLSATDPNTQQQVRGNTKDKQQVKSLGEAAEGYVLVQLDFSQAEVRWLGILSGDQALAQKYIRAAEIQEALKADPDNAELKRALKVEGDLHMSTALTMYRQPMDLPQTDEKKAKELRQRAKTICFGLIYGKTPRSLGLELGLDVGEAKEVVELWLGQFPQAAKWLASMEEQAVEHGYVVSPFGRRRRLPEASAIDVSVANGAKRRARNTPIQSAASDGCIYAACKLRKALLMAEKDPALRAIVVAALPEHTEEQLADVFAALRKQAKLVNTVHDSLVAELPARADVVTAYCALAKSIFTDPMLFKADFDIDVTVPLAVDFEVGLNAGNLTPYDFTGVSLERGMHNAEVLRSQPPGTLLADLKGRGMLYDEVHA